MCIHIARFSGNKFLDPKFHPENLIPSFNHLAYLRFYPNVKTSFRFNKRDFCGHVFLEFFNHTIASLAIDISQVDDVFFHSSRS